jgi:hypothetical protein
MNGFSYPPWNGVTDEISVSDPTNFGNCEQALSAFADQGGGRTLERRYSISKTWGRVLRAKVVFTHASAAGTTHVTCWSVDGPGVQMAVEMGDCGPQQVGC